MSFKRIVWSRVKKGACRPSVPGVLLESMALKNKRSETFPLNHRVLAHTLFLAAQDSVILRWKKKPSYCNLVFWKHADLGKRKHSDKK